MGLTTTQNILSLIAAHIQVDANLKKPFTSSTELIWQSRDIINVDIDYPWTPPSCSYCNQIGHILKNCIYAPAKGSKATDSKVGDDYSVNLKDTHVILLLLTTKLSLLKSNIKSNLQYSTAYARSEEGVCNSTFYVSEFEKLSAPFILGSTAMFAIFTFDYL